MTAGENPYTAPPGSAPAEVSAAPTRGARELSPRDRRRRLAWCMYDWANSAYYTLSITVLVTYIQAVLPGKAGVAVWGYGIGLTEAVVALSAPVLGALADARANKRGWLAGTAMVGSAATALMFFATPDRPRLLVALFILAQLSVELTQGFYNAFLPEIAEPDEMDRLSARGYAFGYVGGGLMLAIFLLLFRFGSTVGLPKPDQDAAYLLPRLGLLITGLWWAIFTVPLLLWLRDEAKPRAPGATLAASAVIAAREVGGTLKNIRAYGTLWIFLLAFLMYNDGVQTVLSQSPVFATRRLNMRPDELAQVVLLIQFVAVPGAMLIAWLADRWGQKPVLLACLVGWIGILCYSLVIDQKWQFWVVGMMVALVMGGTQSVSRAIMGVMTPRQRSAEFFGFFNLTGKATSVFGPVLFATVLNQTGDPGIAIVSLVIFFVLGLALLSRVDVARGRERALAG